MYILKSAECKVFKKTFILNLKSHFTISGKHVKNFNEIVNFSSWITNRITTFSKQIF